MSYSLQTAVWQNGPTDRNEHHVLLALADYADDNGGSIYPAIPTIAAKCRISERTAIRALDGLAAAGWITRKRRRNAVSTYQIVIEKLLSGSAILSHPDSWMCQDDIQDVPNCQLGCDILTPDPITITSHLEEEEDAPAPTTRTPAQVLTDHFRQRTALEPNSRSGTYDRDWLRPLEKFLELSRGDPLAAVDLINRALAVAHGDNEQRKVYTVSCPRSLVGIAANLAATQQARVAGDNADDLWRQALAVVTGTKTGDSRLLTAIRAIGADRIRMARETDVPELKRTLAHGYHRGMAATA